MGQSSSLLSGREVESLREIADSQIEARIAHQELIMMRERAFEQANVRERFMWEVLGAATVTTMLLAAGSLYKRKDFVIPIAAMIMGVGYRYDIAFGSNLHSVQESANSLLKDNISLYKTIGEPITLQTVDNFREKNLSK